MSLSYLTTILLVLPPALGFAWSIYEAWFLASIKLETSIRSDAKPLDALYVEINSECATPEQVHEMKRISDLIAEGSNTFLYQEYKYMLVYVIITSLIVGLFVDVGTAVAFVFGCVTSCVCGFIGMRVATFSNVRTANEASKTLASSFNVALRAGSVMGMMLVSLGIFVMVGLIWVYSLPQFYGNDTTRLFEAIAGYGLGGSSIALFARVGGGIYTKAADVGADLSGKNEYGMKEDDPRNPACIADNVGDNVGDIAGMGADLFGSLAESTCAALVIAGASIAAVGEVNGLASSYSALLFPVTLSSCGILVGITTMFIIENFFKVRQLDQIESTLKKVLVYSTVLETPMVILLSYLFLPSSFAISSFGVSTWWKAALSILSGLWSGLGIGFITEYYTSHSYFPVREISRTQVVSAATGIIYGMALGYMSVVLPVMLLGTTVVIAHLFAGMYGVALAALGMLGTLTMGLAIDAYGPISDNAGGIVEMAKLGPEVRSRTDALDAAGNTTAAIGKGFAIGSAALVSLALFGAFTVRANVTVVDALNPWTFSGLLYGAMMPYAFSAMTMKSVGIAATDMVKECLAQFPAIIKNEARPQYNRCIAISTKAALREMIAPGALVILSPIVAGVLFGKNCTAGLLAGVLVSGIQLAISSSNAGGAWDNAKKYIETGALGAGHGKGSATHKNAVTGDTVGDPLKDTSGPSINILVKLSAIISLVFGSVIADKFSNAAGGPVWLST